MISHLDVLERTAYGFVYVMVCLFQPWLGFMGGVHISVRNDCFSRDEQ